MNGRHKSSQNPTRPKFEPRPLNIAQRNAIPLLCAGHTDAEVAEAVGVARETVWSWRNEVPLFMAELERERQALMQGVVDRLRSALPKAAENLIAAVEEGNLKASIELLKAVGLAGNYEAFKSGSMDPATIATNIVLKRMMAEGIPERETYLLDLDRNPRYDERRKEILQELAGHE